MRVLQVKLVAVPVSSPHSMVGTLIRISGAPDVGSPSSCCGAAKAELTVPEHTTVEVLARFDSMVPWDCERRYDVSQKSVEGATEEEWKADPTRFVYVLTDPHGENRLRVKADLVEILRDDYGIRFPAEK